MIYRVTAAEYELWYAEWVSNPWGEHRADYRNAMQCTMFANVNRSADSAPFDISDFMPFETKQKQKAEMSPQDMKAFFKAMTLGQQLLQGQKPKVK